MPEQKEAEEREIEISWSGHVSAAIADRYNELTTEENYIQEISGDRERITGRVEVPQPLDLLNAAHDALAESDHPRVPNDRDAFGVVEIDIEVEGDSSATIEVYE